MPYLCHADKWHKWNALFYKTPIIPYFPISLYKNSLILIIFYFVVPVVPVVPLRVKTAKNRAIEWFFEVFGADKVADKKADKDKVVRVKSGQGADAVCKNGQDPPKLSACCPQKKPRKLSGAMCQFYYFSFVLSRVSRRFGGKYGFHEGQHEPCLPVLQVVHNSGQLSF